MTPDFPQKDHPSYRLAALDSDFLLGDTTRGLRFMLEYEKAESVMRAHKIRSTIVVFGSARVSETGTERQQRWYNEARRFGRLVSEQLGPLHPDEDGYLDNVITTGGGPGIMEAANRGARDVGAPTIGLNITLPHEQMPNFFTTPALTLRFHYFAMRKMHLAMRAAALVVFPGGFGTFDELFEILTLVQTRKMPEVPIVLVDKAFWHSIFTFEPLAEAGMIKPEDIELMTLVDTADEALAAVTR